MFFSRVVPPRLYRMQNPEKVLVCMYGDLPEDFRNMRDRRKSYNRPIKMRRSEMGIRSVESKKEEREDLQGHRLRWGLFSQDRKGQSCQG
jgi:hypothetical protein